MSRFPQNNNPPFNPNGKIQNINFIPVTNGQRVPHIVTGVTQGGSVSYPSNFPMVVSTGMAPMATPNLGQGHIPTTSQLRTVNLQPIPLGNNFAIPIQTNLHVPTNVKRAQQIGALHLSQINQQAQVIQQMNARPQFTVAQGLDITRQNMVSQQQNIGLRGHGGIAIRPVPQPMSRGQVMQARGMTPSIVGNPQFGMARTPIMRTNYARPIPTGIRLSQQASVRAIGVQQPTIKIEQPQMFGKIISKQQQPIESRAPQIINEEKKPQIPSSVQNKFIHQKIIKQGPIEDLPPSPLPTQSPSIIPQHIQQPITAKPSLMETTPSPHIRVVEPIKQINVNIPTVNQVAPTPRPMSTTQHSVVSTPIPVPGIDLRLENFQQNFIKEVQSKTTNSVSIVPRKKSENHSEELNQQKREIFKEEVEKSIDTTPIPPIPNSYPKFDEFFTQLHLYCLKNPFFYYEIDNEYLYVKTRLNDEIESLQYGFEFFINEASHQTFPITKKLNGEPIDLMDYGKDGTLPQTVNELMNGLFKVMREELMS
ncbi:hypothetical protein ENUP19_0018G0027 [Entamoeba nuttalli]|uniref:Uncharacterized protein n=2 Tax=Entamoeba nuttalli TaxID=412467 RepID=K2HFT0_ENTNP|nr:hypothetical protein ENU1_048840 [Entamoeba nuttalli P19]EKE41649.1 hypothetical protein ENU1_048840 [Entamoeba nuttalli P19]|eukprot:XP_008856020.1 hypothetical protein ENU1_048840 [Entamoeba nuttalli P19]